MKTRLAVVLGFQPSEISALTVDEAAFWDEVARLRMGGVKLEGEA